MSTPSLRLSLLVVLAVATIAQAAILTRAIEAQKSLVEREEQMLEQAKDHVQRTAQNAYDVSRDTVSSMADQLRYVVMYPWRMANEALEKPKLYARYMLSKVPPLLSGEATTPASEVVPDLPPVVADVVEPAEETNRLPLLVSSLQSFFNGAPTEAYEAPKPNPYIEVVEVKYNGPELVPLQTADELPQTVVDSEPSKDVIMI